MTDDAETLACLALADFYNEQPTKTKTMDFIKYMHIERLGNDEVAGILDGDVYVFPKIDGTNSSVWIGEDCKLRFASRNRELSIDNDNAGFMAKTMHDANIGNLLLTHRNLRLYGEWLVPHSLKAYDEKAWNKFYVFDVFDDVTQTFMPYNEYSTLLNTYGIEYIPAMGHGMNPNQDSIIRFLDQNHYLLKDGYDGVGEGVVIKNYGFKNKFGRTTWAKIVTNEFKAKHAKEMGPNEIKNIETHEYLFALQFVTASLVEKTVEKIKEARGEWNSRMIPQLLGTVFHDVVVEDTWTYLKKNKNVVINFKELERWVITQIKTVKPELF